MGSRLSYSQPIEREALKRMSAPSEFNFGDREALGTPSVQQNVAELVSY